MSFNHTPLRTWAFLQWISWNFSTGREIRIPLEASQISCFTCDRFGLSVPLNSLLSISPLLHQSYTQRGYQYYQQRLVCLTGIKFPHESMWDSRQCMLQSLWHDHNGHSWIVRISVGIWRRVDQQEGLKQVGHCPACPKPTLQPIRHMMKCFAHLLKVFWFVVHKLGLFLLMDYA